MAIIQTILTLVISTSTVLTLLYKTGYKNIRKRENDYYNNVLKPIVETIKSNNNVNITKSLGKIVKFSDDSVPKYIFYLMSQSENEKLKKVLIYDYFDIYDCEENLISNVLKFFKKIMVYIFIFLSILLAVVFAFNFSSHISLVIFTSIKESKLDTFNIKELLQSLQLFVLDFLLLFISVFSLYCAKFSNTYMYTFKKKRIENIVKKKVKKYNKIMDNFFY